mmetsp:Transcript_66099/g.213755  ORF Transcript_66099/g.213755 Transcript_66099/m.213755 type:complete len:97 (+) Transcript_66099:165-455(+)
MRWQWLRWWPRVWMTHQMAGEFRSGDARETTRRADHQDCAARRRRGAEVVRDGCRGLVGTRALSADAPQREREERDDIQEEKLYDVDVEVQQGSGR